MSFDERSYRLSSDLESEMDKVRTEPRSDFVVQAVQERIKRLQADSWKQADLSDLVDADAMNVEVWINAQAEAKRLGA